MKKLWFLFVLLLVLVPFKSLIAVGKIDVGLNVVNSAIQLGSQDPRVMISKIINTAMLFLGIMGVIMVLIGGFKWMTAGGNDDQVKSAKKVLGQAAVGLMIVLASWGFTQFILEKLVQATNN